MSSDRATGEPRCGSAPRSQIVLVSSHIARLVLSLAITVILGRALEPHELGFFALVSVIFVVARELIDLGSTGVATRDIAGNPGREKPTLETLLGLRRCLALVAATLCTIFAFTTPDVLQQSVLLATALVVAFLHVSAFGVVFMLRQAFAKPSLFGVATQCAMLAACLVLVPLKVAGVVFSSLVVLREVVVLLGTRFFALGLLEYRPRVRIDRTELKRFLGPALTVGLCSVLSNVWLHSGTFLVWLLRSEAELGAYSAAFRPLFPLMVFGWLITLPMLPVWTRLASHDRGSYRRQVLATFHVCVGFGFTVAVAGFVLAPEIITILFGGKYLVGELSAVSTFRWYCITLGLASVAPVFGTAMLADGHEKLLLKIAIVGVAINLTASSVLIPMFGFTGAAMSSAATELVVFCGALVCTRAALAGGEQLRDVVYSAGPGIVLLALLWFVPGSPFFQVLASAILTMIALLSVWFMPRARQHRAELVASEWTSGRPSER